MSTSKYLKEAVKKVEKKCIDSGVRLTRKRKNVLLVLLRNKMPISAYELAEKYKAYFDEALPVMSAYRILDILVQEKLAHKLDKNNQYLACAQITCEHDIPQFLICSQCRVVKEIALQKATVNRLRASVDATGFQLINQQLELYGLCESCFQHERNIDLVK